MRSALVRISLAAALVGAALVFIVLAPEAFGVWARRNLLMSEELWPRSTHLCPGRLFDLVAQPFERTRSGARLSRRPCQRLGGWAKSLDRP